MRRLILKSKRFHHEEREGHEEKQIAKIKMKIYKVNGKSRMKGSNRNKRIQLFSLTDILINRIMLNEDKAD